MVIGLKNAVCKLPVKDTSLVHMIHCLDELIHVPPDPFLCHIMTAAAYELIDVHVHELKHQCQPPCGLVTASSTLFRPCLVGMYLGCKRSALMLQYAVVCYLLQNL